MEQFYNRNRFNEELFIEVSKKLDLPRKLLDQLYSDDKNPLKDSMVVLRKLGSMGDEKPTLDKMGLKGEDRLAIEKMINTLKKDIQKCFLISQYTQDRHPVKYLAGLLREFEQEPIAKHLEKYNQSEKDWPYGFEQFIQVKETNNLKDENSTSHNLSGKVKGICNIFLNAVEFKNQALLYERIFKQMNFEVMLKEGQTKQQIKTYLMELATNQYYENHQSLVNIFVCHGHNGLISCSEPQQPNVDNIASIRELIDIFNDSKDPKVKPRINFTSKPKVYIFDTCRIKEKSKGKHWCLANCQDDWVNKSSLTTVVYSCAEGQLAMYLMGFSVYGRALCYSIAQFACDFDLDKLLKKAERRLENDFEELKNIWTHFWRDEWKQLPEVKQSNTKKDIYFNPGCHAD